MMKRLKNGYVFFLSICFCHFIANGSFVLNLQAHLQWVQCDKCEAWQHQICALFNGRRNDGGQAEYTCPNCYIQEVERGERKPLPQSAVLGAKDLPRTILSDHIEQRLFKRLKQERQERARLQGKSYDEVIAYNMFSFKSCFFFFFFFGNERMPFSFRSSLVNMIKLQYVQFVPMGVGVLLMKNK
jgi:hypothetical protein